MKRINKKLIKTIIVLLVVVILGIIIFIGVNIYNNRQLVATPEEIQDYLNISLIKKDAEEKEYFIEQKDVAVLSYTKGNMNFILKSTSNPQKDVVDNNHKWGPVIHMYCDVEDNLQVQVVSHMDEETQNYMKAEWTDNDLYYGIITDNLTTREDFLQEVNRVVLENHIIKD